MVSIVTPIVVVMATLVLGPVAIVGSLLMRSGDITHNLGKLWARIILFSAGVSLKVDGRENIPEGTAVVFACNHASQFDIPILYVSLPGQFRFLAKKELFRVPLLGLCMRTAGYIPIDRSGGRAALESMKDAAGRIRNGTSVAIFPEGTRSPDGRLRPFKSGGFTLAIKAGCPVVPVAISGSHRVLPKGSLTVRPGRVRVSIAPAVPTTNNETHIERADLMKRVRDEITSMLDEENRPVKT